MVSTCSFSYWVTSVIIIFNLIFENNHVIQFCGCGLLTFIKLLLFPNVDFPDTTPIKYHLNCSADIESNTTANNKSFASITLDGPSLTPRYSEVTVRLLSNPAEGGPDGVNFSIGEHELVYAAFDTNETQVANCSVSVIIRGKLISLASCNCLK